MRGGSNVPTGPEDCRRIADEIATHCEQCRRAHGPPRRDPSGDISFRALRRADLELLARWLSAAHVQPWWNEAYDRASLEARYLPIIAGCEPTYVFIIEHALRPVGWVQWARWRDYPQHASRLGAEPTAAGIDIALGEPDMLATGIGSRAIRAFVERIVFGDPCITACITDPDAANHRSLRAFAKAGFITVGSGYSNGPALRCIVRLDRP
jgi:aminoglycoside 6'-N-acetyltransferase